MDHEGSNNFEISTIYVIQAGWAHHCVERRGGNYHSRARQYIYHTHRKFEYSVSRDVYLEGTFSRVTKVKQEEVNLEQSTCRK